MPQYIPREDDEDGTVPRAMVRTESRKTERETEDRGCGVSKARPPVF